MGGSSSKEIPQKLGPDELHVPSWASDLNVEKCTKVFFDIAVNKKFYGRVEMTLADEVVPKTFVEYTI